MIKKIYDIYREKNKININGYINTYKLREQQKTIILKCDIISIYIKTKV